jgi:ligand-binding sensor domain-containing protein
LISEKDGLPFNTTTALIQDKRGFIWISSIDGITRYDGYSFVIIQRKPNDSSSLPNNNVVALSIDNKGMIWAGHIGGYVSRINPLTFRVWYTKIEGADETSVNKIFCDSKGTIWCAVQGKGLYQFDGKAHFKFICSLNDRPDEGNGHQSNYNIINDIYEDEEHNLWLGSNNGLYKFYPSRYLLNHISSLGDKQTPAFINRLLPDKNGFWCATYGTGLIYYDLRENKFEKYLFQNGYKGTHNIIYGMARKSDHEIWLGTYGSGTGFFDTNNKTFTFFLEKSKLGSGPMCSGLMVDRSGIIWVLSEKGLHKWDINESHFTFYKLPVSHSDNYNYYEISAVLNDENNKRTILGTSFADGLHIIDAKGNDTILPFSTHPNAEPYLLVNDIIRGKNGNIFVLTRDFYFNLLLTIV